MFAAGYSLSLCDYWEDDAAYIRQLVELRRTYADALIYGTPAYPAANRIGVGAYRYMGAESELLIIVNAGNPYSNQKIELGEELAGSEWTYLLGGEGTVKADKMGKIEMKVAHQAMAVLKRN